MRHAWILTILIVGCILPKAAERDCETRTAYYPDPDGDGIGDRSEIVLACSQPDGWVELVAGTNMTNSTTTTTTGTTTTTTGTTTTTT
ncbi:MAG: hypothetical protein GWP91_24195, partial [Rhodobacterales bacterium]|nr:hypothetical protein [Rhodobacterales bacterium]